jgi:hypothetical protein
VVIHCFSFCLLGKTLIGPSILNDSFGELSILELKLFSFSAQKTSLYALLAFKVSVEKSADFDWFKFVCYLFFSLTAFNILSLFSVLFESMIICHVLVLFWSSLLCVL